MAAAPPVHLFKKALLCGAILLGPDKVSARTDWGAETCAPAGSKSVLLPAQSAGSWLIRHLAIGTRMTVFRFMENRRHWPDHFYGTITELREEQNYWPIKCFADLNFTRYFGMEATWDQIQADALCNDTTGLSDGTIDLRGPIFSVFGRYPVARFVPYAGVGLMMIYSSFNPTAAWRYRGQPPAARDEQAFAFDNAVAPVIYGGLGVQFSRQWSADLYVRHIDMELEGEHYFKLNGKQHNGVRKVEIPMSNIAGGISIRYAF